MCTQCNHCVAACPHSAIRAKAASQKRWSPHSSCTRWM
ncbi:4Fe-4S binding protein [Shigella flexneri]